MDIEGDTIAIGAPYTGSNDEGAVRIYTRTNGAWSQQQALLATDAGDSDRFGHSVSLSGDTLVLGTAWMTMRGTTLAALWSGNASTAHGRKSTNWSPNTANPSKKQATLLPSMETPSSSVQHSQIPHLL